LFSFCSRGNMGDISWRCKNYFSIDERGLTPGLGFLLRTEILSRSCSHEVEQSGEDRDASNRFARDR
jgi:hypothetical protein